MVGRSEGALEVHLDDRVPLGFGHVREHPVAQDAGVVHHHIQAAEGVDGLVDEVLAAVPAGDVVGVGDGLPARGFDLVDDGLGGAGRGPRAVAAAAEVVDDDLGALLGEQLRVFAADAVASPGDDDDASLADPGHARTPAVTIYLLCLLVPLFHMMAVGVLYAPFGFGALFAFDPLSDRNLPVGEGAGRGGSGVPMHPHARWGPQATEAPECLPGPAARHRNPTVGRAYATAKVAEPLMWTPPVWRVAVSSTSTRRRPSFSRRPTTLPE